MLCGPPLRGGDLSCGVYHHYVVETSLVCESLYVVETFLYEVEALVMSLLIPSTT